MRPLSSYLVTSDSYNGDIHPWKWKVSRRILFSTNSHEFVEKKLDADCPKRMKNVDADNRKSREQAFASLN